ncbi:uncharacterized protein LTR77_006752 [Saxophila tyrrhenica]|uniref:Uncharacterized protein n=1 Tax=Saxophila tyrrhenica TaxID=1690608 RepID=A0AAV9P637_9PEZI|nr:hypothetical protein LTR77_006752 [Saxophila tyrrhenica]
MDVAEPSEDINALAQRHGIRVKYYKTDVASEESIASSFERAKQDFGRIDNCITAAGIALEGDFLSHDWDRSRKVLDINVLGSFFCAQHAASCTRQQNSPGSIVMIASVASHCALPGQFVSLYGASKAAVKLLGKTLAVELAPYNIRVNTISPGFIETEMSGALAVKKPELFEVFRKSPPLLRIGQRQDLTMAAAYLLSSSASYVTGEDIAVTGGLHAGRIKVSDTVEA